MSGSYYSLIIAKEIKVSKNKNKNHSIPELWVSFQDVIDIITTN